jgi:hypothetical protein
VNNKRFRVWLYNDDYRLGRYFTPEDNYIDDAQTTSLVLNLAGDVVCVIHKKEPREASLIWARIGNSGITVNQSTLVHDSQGVEIFEDDVVLYDSVKYFVLDPDTLRILNQETVLPIPAEGDLTVIGKISPMAKDFYEGREVAPPVDFYFIEDFNK